MGRQLTPAEYDEIHQPILDLYDAGIVYTDFLLGQVIDIWHQRGTLNKTIFVVLGDHGEHVGEHGSFGHLASVYEEDLWVPFAIHYPPKITPGQRVAQEISTMGLFATIFDLLELPPPKTVLVPSLVPAFEGSSEGDVGAPFGRPVMAERFEEKLLSARFKPGTANGTGPLLTPWGRYRVYRSGDYKLVKHVAQGKFSTHLFDLSTDPGEMNDLAGQASVAADLRQLEAELRSWEILRRIPSLDAPPGGSGKPIDDPTLSDEAQEQLRALGYIE